MQQAKPQDANPKKKKKKEKGNLKGYRENWMKEIGS
jgi:hypothetical protein